MATGKVVSAKVEVIPNHQVRVRFLPGAWNPADGSQRVVELLQTIDGAPLTACRNSYLRSYAEEVRIAMNFQLGRANVFPFFFKLDGNVLHLQGLLLGEQDDIFHERVLVEDSFNSFEVEWQVLAIPGFSIAVRQACERAGKFKDQTIIDLDYLYAVYGINQAALFRLSSEIELKFPRPGQPEPAGRGTLVLLRTDHIRLDSAWHEIESRALTSCELRRDALPESLEDACA